jgi:hypothetical protein
MIQSKFLKYGALLAGAGLLAAGGAMISRQASAADDANVPVTVIVTATAHGEKNMPAISQNEVVVKQQDSHRQVVSWEPVQPNGSDLEVMVLVDDSLTMHVANDLNDVRNFVRTLPENAKVEVAYADYGGVKVDQAFTADHAHAASAFRLPQAIPGTSNGFFDSVREAIKQWPEDSSRHVLVVVSSGIDLTNGAEETEPELNLPLQKAINEAQRKNVVVFTVYASPDTRFLRQNQFLTLNGAGSLGRLADETGGESFWQGTTTPVSMAPYLNQIRQMLGQQYKLTFMADTKLNNSKLHVTAEQSGVTLRAPEYVHVPKS